MTDVSKLNRDELDKAVASAVKKLESKDGLKNATAEDFQAVFEADEARQNLHHAAAAYGQWKDNHPHEVEVDVLPAPEAPVAPGEHGNRIAAPKTHTHVTPTRETTHRK